MELIFLPGSPWSTSLMWSLYYGKSISNNTSTFTRTKGGGPFTYWYISWKLGAIWPDVPMTLPMLIETGKPALTSSVDIAAKLCSGEQFPLEHQASIREWHAKVDKVQRFARGVFLEGGLDNIVEKMIGKIPVITNLFHRRMLASMRLKYMEEDCAISKEEVVGILKEMSKVIRQQEFFLGGSHPTYVDFIAATAIQCIETKPKKVLVTDLATNTNLKLHAMLIEPNKTDLEPLLDWKDKIYTHYYFCEEMQEMRLNASFFK